MDSLTNQLIDTIEFEINKPDIKNKLHCKVIEPLMNKIFNKTQGYFTTIISLYGVVILLQFLILIFLLSKK